MSRLLFLVLLVYVGGHIGAYIRVYIRVHITPALNRSSYEKELCGEPRARLAELCLPAMQGGRRSRSLCSV